VASVRDLVRNVLIRLGNVEHVLVARSPLISRILSADGEPHAVLSEAEVISSTSQRVAVITDNIGFMNSLGYLGIMRIRGSVVIVVLDLDDIRPLCDYLGLPCLEPWDQGSLGDALREGIEYSEALELPYVVRIGPWISVEGSQPIDLGMRRRVTFNRNWSRGANWGVDRLRRVRPNLDMVINRAVEFVTREGDGEGVLVSGSAWGLIGNELVGYSIIRSLYVNPLPREGLGADYVADTGDYLRVKLNLRGIMEQEVAARWKSLVEGSFRELFFREAGDPLMLIEWAVREVIGRDQVTIVVGDPSLVPYVDDGEPSFDALPTWFEPDDARHIYSLVAEPIPALLGLLRVGYDLGRVLVIVHACSVPENLELKLDPNYALMILDGGECGVRMSADKHITIDASDILHTYYSLVEAISRGGVILVDTHRSRGDQHIVLREYCDVCGDCFRIGCPALSPREGYPSIDPNLCIGCGICSVVCSRGAIEPSR
jgi:indolepyruvate ferredoxin oxidoreductase alpha subunit